MVDPQEILSKIETSVVSSPPAPARSNTAESIREILKLLVQWFVEQFTLGMAEKMPISVTVPTYAALLALENPKTETFYTVTSDEVNNGGNPSKYSKTPTGEIWWWASLKIN